MVIDTTVRIGALELKNPVLAASGTYGYGDEVAGLADIAKLGGLVTKSLSMNARPGNPPPRIVETASGLLNSIGLANIGVRSFISDKLPYLRQIDTALVANIAASSVDEYGTVLRLLEEEEGIRAYEINVSCPNVKEGGLSFGTDPKMTATITGSLRKLTSKPLIIKLTPNVTSVGEFAHVVEAEGADAVSVMNTLVGMAVDIEQRVPRLSTTTGGLSGPAIKPVALAKVFETAQRVSIPVIGIGGIMTAEDAIEFLLVGATAIQVGTANFIDPSAGIKIAQGIKDYCVRHAVPAVRSLTGSIQIQKGLSVLHSWL